MGTNGSKLKLPRILKVVLRRFSLYTASPDAEFECGDGVLCLIGANGIGKSTLLSAINFCLTGIVSDPDRRFESMEEYYNHSLNFSKSYFRGRISERDREAAEITVDFTIGDSYYSVKRGMFEPEELRGLTVSNGNGTEVVSVEDKTRRELQQLYAERLTSDVGLSTFPEFVFLQHFVFTFDERRKTLFWDQKILERILYLSFGMDPSLAKRVDMMRREIESKDSLVRNYQWQATSTRKEINKLQQSIDSSSTTQETYEALADQQEKLSEQLTDETESLNTIEKQLKDANLGLADFTAKESALRDEYERLFDERLRGNPQIAGHPLVLSSIVDQRCGLCGNAAASVKATIEFKAQGSTCPLCDLPISSNGRTDIDGTQLQRLDEELGKTKAKIRDSLKEIARLRNEERVARSSVEKTQVALERFEAENESTLLTLRTKLRSLTDLRSQPGGLDVLLNSYRTQLDDLMRKKDEAYSKRTRLKEELLRIQRGLEGQYAAAEKDFVPLFTELAHLFLGMELDVGMEASTATGLSLVISVRGTSRREPHNLSESQRFFVDIALRMALTQYISAPDAKGGMYIDTPEGSLDIAYEKRAGDMLSRFVNNGHQIIMTANLNSSKLLITLATNCKRQKMQTVRMMDWADLSDVQIAENDLFEQAFSDISLALDS
jgi:DNA repair exonuclease SbcCD ATPase subunit